MTAAIKDNLREKRRLHRLAKKWPDTYKDQYISHRDHCNLLIKNASNEYYRDELESCRGNIKKTWQTINTILGRSRKNVNNIKCPEENIKVADYINNYFIRSIDAIKEELPQTENNSFMQYMGEPTPYSMRVKLASAAEIIKIVNTFISKKSSGYDGISMNLFKIVHRMQQKLQKKQNCEIGP